MTENSDDEIEDALRKKGVEVRTRCLKISLRTTFQSWRSCRPQPDLSDEPLLQFYFLFGLCQYLVHWLLGPTILLKCFEHAWPFQSGCPEDSCVLAYVCWCVQWVSHSSLSLVDFMHPALRMVQKTPLAASLPWRRRVFWMMLRRLRWILRCQGKKSQTHPKTSPWVMPPCRSLGLYFFQFLSPGVLSFGFPASDGLVTMSWWPVAQDSPKDSPGGKSHLAETSPAEAEVSEKPPEAEPVEGVVESWAR